MVEKKSEKTLYTIELTVEFKKNILTTIPFTSESIQWSHFATDGGTKIKIKPEHFAYDNRVSDLTIGRFIPGHLKLEPMFEQPPSSKKTVVVVIESPHRHEYEKMEPLANKNSRTSFLANIGLICNFWLKESAAVILCNPIGWQTSLAELYPSSVTADLLAQVRDGTWTNIWNYEANGKVPAREAFKRRFKRYEPILVVNACTKSLYKKLGRYLTELTSAPIVDANHPADWSLLRNLPDLGDKSAD